VSKHKFFVYLAHFPGKRAFLMDGSMMKETKRMTRVALIGAVLFCTFFSLSNILYLEAITIMIIAVAMVFDRRDSFQASLVFGVLLILYLGLTPWSIMYFIIYPCYSLLTNFLKPILKEKEWLLIVYGFILSCSTGLILDLPFILVSELVTIYYILTGLKTSLIQGALTAMEIALIYEPLEKILFKIKEMHK
jgi:hypothetical protein